MYIFDINEIRLRKKDYYVFTRVGILIELIGEAWPLCPWAMEDYPLSA